jgi:signal transduction histidine kinase
MIPQTMTPGPPARPQYRPWSWPARHLVARSRALALCRLPLACLGLLAALSSPLTFTGLGVWITLNLSRWQLHPAVANAAKVAPFAAAAVMLYLTPTILLALRRLARYARRLNGEWCGVPIADPYLPAPTAGKPIGARRLRWLARDPATWRDLLWAFANVRVGWMLAVPAALVAYGLASLTAGSVWHGIALSPPAGTPRAALPVLAVAGLVMAAAGLWLAPWLLRFYGVASHGVLAPTRRVALTLRMDHLAQTRAEAIDTGAAEMRRIERDLHDGAQARLVAMGMTLDAAVRVLDENPSAARALVMDARESSAQALGDLRNLIRGIHPPVLADRGLPDAVRALAMDSGLRVDVAADLPGRLPAPVESAAYFAVSELLANAAKHAAASQVWVDVRHEAGTLRLGVTDDGHGGADPDRGTGLRGIERRLAAFDGVLAISSPAGGPTAVTMEIPCVLSLPKTSS